MTFDVFYRDTGTYKHFGSHEWLTKGSAHSTRGNPAFGLNTDPPRELWEAAIPLFRCVDDLRAFAKTRITLVSVYRSPAYNRRIPGAEPNSYHTKFIAADLVPLDITPTQLWNLALKFRSSGAFRGGIGRYKKFVHVDVRGRNADW